MRRGQLASYCRSVPGGRVTIHYPRGEFAGGITTEFDDGMTCNGRKIDHDMTHHFVAFALRWPFSRVLWEMAHAGSRPEGWARSWLYTPSAEEYLVEHLQRFVACGESDEMIQEVWGDRLPVIGMHLSTWLKPWLAVPLMDLPLPLDIQRISRPIAA